MEEKTDAPLILIGTPSGNGQVCSEYLFGALQAVSPKYENNYRVGFLIREGSSHIAKARDNMAMTFYLQTQADYLLFIDSDQGFTPEDIIALLDVVKLGYDIAAAPVPKKSIDAAAAIIGAIENFDEGQSFAEVASLVGGYEYNLVLDDPQDTSRVREVRSIGTGMMLISRSAIKRMVRNELSSENQYLFPDKFGIEKFVPSLFTTVFWDGGYLGEDFAFCHRARKAGLKIGVDTSLKIAHKGQYLYEGDFATFERVKALLKESNQKNAPENGNEKTS